MPHVTREPGAGDHEGVAALRTSAHWREHCERILREISPDFRAAGPFESRKIDVRRTLPSGLIVSHSYFVNEVRDYHQGFAVLWSVAPEKSPYALLRAGTRFFDRPLSEMLAMDGIPRPAGLRDSQTWRSNSIPLLARSLAVAEREILPAYLQLIERGAGHLARFFTTALDLIGERPAPLPRGPTARARFLGVDQGALEPYRSAAWVVTATDILLSRQPYTDIPAAVRDRAVVFARLDDLAAVAHELPEMTRTLGAI